MIFIFFVYNNCFFFPIFDSVYQFPILFSHLYVLGICDGYNFGLQRSHTAALVDTFHHEVNRRIALIMYFKANVQTVLSSEIIPI